MPKLKEILSRLLRRNAYTAIPIHTTLSATDGQAPFAVQLMMKPRAPVMFIHW